MKKIECEACGSNDLLKQGDFFVCQNCGCKYTVEDVRKMMIEGTVEVKGTVSIDTSKKEKGLLDLCEAAYKNGDEEELEKHATKLLENNPNLWQGWFYKGVCSEIHSPWWDNPLEQKETITFYEKAYSVASEKEKQTASKFICNRLSNLLVDRFSYFVNGNYLKNKGGAKGLFKETYIALLGYIKKFNIDYITLHDTEDRVATIFYNHQIEERNQLKDKFTNKETCYGDADDWAAKNINIVTNLINFLADGRLTPDLVDKSYALMLAILKHVVHAHDYRAEDEYSRRTGKYETVYHDEGLILDNNTITNLKGIWKDMSSMKQDYLDKANERETKYHTFKNEIYWSAHKEEKEKLESQVSAADKKIQPYLVQISELDEDIASQKALLSKPLKEEDNALALKKEADDAQAAFKKLGLFDKNRKAAKGVWEQKQNTYEAAKKVADKARSDFNARIKANIKELEDEKAGLVKAKEGIEKELNYAKNELNKNR